MPLTDLASRFDERHAAVYLAVGLLSLGKAIALRNDGRRSRRELREALLYAGGGLALLAYHRRRRRGERSAEGDAADATLEDSRVGRIVNHLRR